MFKLDSPLMNFLNKVADIMILNILFLVFSIPIFTMGASFSAAYYVGFKMVKNEEGYITRTFWRAFKENFKQATIMWLIVLAVGVIIFFDYRIILYSGIEFPQWMLICVITVTVVVLMGVMFIFPLQAHFENKVKNTLKNAFLMALSHLPTAFVLVVVYVVPVVIYYFLPQSLPALFLLAMGLILYFKCFLILRVFKKYEEALVEKEEAEGGEDPDGGIFAESERIEEELDVTAQTPAEPEASEVLQEPETTQEADPVQEAAQELEKPQEPEAVREPDTAQEAESVQEPKQKMVKVYRDGRLIEVPDDSEDTE